MFKSIFWSEKRNDCIFIAAFVKYIIEKCFQSWVHDHLSTMGTRKICYLKNNNTNESFQRMCDHSQIMVMKIMNRNIQNLLHVVWGSEHENW